MRVLVVGATGVIGRELIPALLTAGHEVVGTSRSVDGARSIDVMGAAGEVLDIYDTDAVRALLTRTRPDAVVSEVTDLPDSLADLKAGRSANARVRREAVPALVTAVRKCGVRHILVQSIDWPASGEGGVAVDTMEAATLAAGGVVLRYGQVVRPRHVPPDPSRGANRDAGTRRTPYGRPGRRPRRHPDGPRRGRVVRLGVAPPVRTGRSRRPRSHG